MTKYYAILVAGGSGNRMQSAVAKQFLLLNDRPVIMHTIEAFYRCGMSPQIFVVLNKHQHFYWAELCSIHHFKIPHQVIEGGAQRFHSVKNGLDAITDEGIVAVHDAVRPLVSPELISRCYHEAEKSGNCVAYVKPTDSIRKINPEGGSTAVNRNDFVMIQTPQTFRVNQLKQCYQTPYVPEFTDDASVAEYNGVSIQLIEGERENLKITYPEDLEVAAILLKKRGY